MKMHRFEQCQSTERRSRGLQEAPPGAWNSLCIPVPVDKNKSTNKNVFQSKAHLPPVNIRSNTYNLTLEVS